ncbi:oligosaccharide flippase family protein [bacterium]|nr:oligosaccharide flippase family protein [bacterium]NUN44323.1 polysaccharide biosynthesis protein [bacterium]
MSSALGKKAFVVTAAGIVTTGIDLLTAIIIVRLLDKSDFAVMSYLLMIFQVGRFIATMGFPDSIFYFFERTEIQARRALVLQTFTIVGLMALVVGLAIGFLPLIIESFLSAEWEKSQIEYLKQFLPWMSLVMILEVPTWPVTNILIAFARTTYAAWYQIITSIMTLLALAVPLILKFPLSYAIYGLAAYAFIRFVMSWYLMDLILPPDRESLAKGSVIAQIRFSVIIGSASLISRFNKHVDKFIVAAILTPVALAEYNIGAQEIPIVAVIPYAVSSALIGQFVRHIMDEDRQRLTALWHSAIRNVTMIVVPITIFFIASAQDFICLMFGSSYMASIIPFQVFSLIVLHRVTSYGGALQAFGDKRGILFLSLFLVLTNTLLCVPFTYWWGITGTAVAAWLANMAAWCMALRRIGNHMKLPFYKVIPFHHYLKVLILAALSGLATWFIRYRVLDASQHASGFVISFVIYAIVFFLLSWKFGLVHRETIRRAFIALGK